jgi:heterodisulfide reductase subunit A-like polyferredoxin
MGENGALQVLYEDTTQRNTREMTVDMVVLAQPIIPAAGLENFAALLGVERGREGFILLPDDKFFSPATSQSRVLACGCCQGPADAVQSVISASAAALRAAEILAQRRAA